MCPSYPVLSLSYKLIRPFVTFSEPFLPWPRKESRINVNIRAKMHITATARREHSSSSNRLHFSSFFRHLQNEKWGDKTRALVGNRHLAIINVFFLLCGIAILLSLRKFYVAKKIESSILRARHTLRL